MIENEEHLCGRKLAKGETFTFACGPDLDCFNSCCRDKRLPLWPYDVLRLRRALHESSAKILESYVELEFDPNSGWPALRLRLDEQGRCPFVSPSGCKVYLHRPAACRIYPLARAVSSVGESGKPSEVFLCQETNNCLGWDQDREHTTETWTLDQDLEPYHAANDQLIPLFFHPKRRGRLELTPPQIHAVIASLYNVDVFREIALKSELSNMFGKERIEKALETEDELLALGRDFLINRLFQ